MSDYIKRLEEALTTGGRRYAGPVLAQDLRRTLADVERMRGALEEIVDRPGCGMDWARGVGQRSIDAIDEAANMARIARRALSAPNTGGTHD